MLLTEHFSLSRLFQTASTRQSVFWFLLSLSMSKLSFLYFGLFLPSARLKHRGTHQIYRFLLPSSSTFNGSLCSPMGFHPQSNPVFGQIRRHSWTIWIFLNTDWLISSCWQLLQRSYPASFPFLSRPFLVFSREQAQQMSTHLPLASSAASIGKGYPFRKNPRFRLPTIAGILLVGKCPKPSWKSTKKGANEWNNLF